MVRVGCLAVALLAPILLASATPATYDNEHTWIAGDLSYPFPKNAVLGGVSTQGYYVYVGRVKYEGVFPVQLRAEIGQINWHNGTYYYIGTKNYDILVPSAGSSFEWITSHDGKFERGLVAVGTNLNDERVFVCRAITPYGQLPGTLILSLKACSVSGTKVRYDKYEVLVDK
ncbi:uncharacterized protein LOC108091426 [Drosophila ficusphila]|uniref:uncharacterized protein LOC108091426 n=1 Tax=Drosophila ficusphila TaxID=30025 RepID=UPI0007E8AEB3|nr:uncharacterized protein LOC108091426 [Drosophila ficusphila]